MKQKKVSKAMYYFLYSLIICTTVLYLGWRIFYTIPLSHGIIAILAGTLLLLAELLGMLESLQHYYGMGTQREPPKPELPDDMFPEIDVLIASYDEDSSLLYKSINGCKNMEYPNQSKVHIYLCDDSNRAEIKILCDQLQVGYITRKEHVDAKAGNLNHAMKGTHSPYIVTLDADMIPFHNFLMELVPYLFLPEMMEENGIWRKRTHQEIDASYKIGFVQSPQSFYNTDLFQYNLFSEHRVPNEQDYFYRDVQLARNKTNSAIYGGSNTILSRAALDEIGGFYTGVITEDFATGICMQAKGYTSYAIAQTLAIGLAPSDVKSLIKQRERWARGCIQSIRKTHVWRSKTLSLGQKISYLSSLNYWYTPYRRLLYILSPILFSLFHITVVDATLQGILIFWLPHFIISHITSKKLSGNIRNAHLSNLYDTILFPSLLLPVLKETLGFKQKTFSVTKKHKQRIDARYQIRLALPHFLFTILSVLAIIQCLYDSFQSNSMMNAFVLFWLCANLYALLMSLLFMMGRAMFRSNERMSLEADIMVTSAKKSYPATTIDVSDTGLSIRFVVPVYLAPKETIKFTFLHKQYPVTLYGRVIHVYQMANADWFYGFKITHFEHGQKDHYFNLIYAQFPSLPRYIDQSSNRMKDLTTTLFHRFKKTKYWNRKLPRIPLMKSIQTTSKKTVVLRNFNYEYIQIDWLNQIIERKLELHLSNELSMQCILCDPSKHHSMFLYHIVNNLDLIESNEFHEILIDWMKEYEQKRQA